LLFVVGGAIPFDTMTLTLMRHPHIDFAAQRCIGQTDVDLSFEGKSSLKSIAGQACRLFPDLVISSDLKRCRLLAEEIAAQLRIRAVFDPIWREIDFGFWENRTWEAIRREETESFAEWVADFVRTAPPGGESFLQLQKRILSAIDEVLPDHTGETSWMRAMPITLSDTELKNARQGRRTASVCSVSKGAKRGRFAYFALKQAFMEGRSVSPNVLVVTHAGVMRAAYAVFANLPLSHAFDYKIPYGGMLHLSRRGSASAIESTSPFSPDRTA
jgi:broad specificity phosphatase PhoE